LIGWETFILLDKHDEEDQEADEPYDA
jgi:hypothetical protein